MVILRSGLLLVTFINRLLPYLELVDVLITTDKVHNEIVVMMMCKSIYKIKMDIIPRFIHSDIIVNK